MRWYTNIILVTHRAAIHTIEALGNWHPHLVAYVEQVVRAEQLHLRKVSRASAFKLYMLRAEQSDLSEYRLSSQQLCVNISCAVAGYPVSCVVNISCAAASNLTQILNILVNFRLSNFAQFVVLREAWQKKWNFCFKKQEGKMASL